MLTFINSLCDKELRSRGAEGLEMGFCVFSTLCCFVLVLLIHLFCFLFYFGIVLSSHFWSLPFLLLCCPAGFDCFTFPWLFPPVPRYLHPFFVFKWVSSHCLLLFRLHLDVKGTNLFLAFPCVIWIFNLFCWTSFGFWVFGLLFVLSLDLLPLLATYLVFFFFISASSLSCKPAYFLYLLLKP